MVCMVCKKKIYGIGLISNPYDYTVHLDCVDNVKSKTKLEWNNIIIKGIK